jgi:hypothetical protein
MYPKQIEEYSTIISEHFKSWAIEQDADANRFSNYMKDSVCKKVFPKWLNSEDVILNESEVIECLNYAWAEYNLNSLKEKGLIDSIEDENGEEVWFPTEAGKKTVKNPENV